jgi:CHAD domain-containing protein
MGKNIPESICIFGGSFMLEQVRNIIAELEGVQLSEDIESVHRMRVASRRLRNGLELFKECLPGKKAKTCRDDVQKITRALGKARDLDIQIELLTRFYDDDLDAPSKPGYARLLLRLKQRRAKAQSKIDTTVHKLQEGQILAKMSARFEKLLRKADQTGQLTPELYQKAFDEIADSLTAFLAYETILGDSNNVEKLHAMRLAGKRLRYTLEIFAPLYNERLDPFITMMKDIQDQLGEIHDDDVWVDWLPKFINEERTRIEDYFGHSGPLDRLLPGLHFLIKDRQQAREDAYQRFLLTWSSIQEEDAWGLLQQVVQVPVNTVPDPGSDDPEDQTEPEPDFIEIDINPEGSDLDPSGTPNNPTP